MAGEPSDTKSAPEALIAKFQISKLLKQGTTHLTKTPRDPNQGIKN